MDVRDSVAHHLLLNWVIVRANALPKEATTVSEKTNIYNDGIPEMEDYGGSDGGEARGASSQSQAGKHAGGDEGPNQSSGRVGRFGEFDNTGTGIDLTVEMESNEADPRSGLIKGGQRGEDALVGPAQYGGEAGDLPIKGNIDGNE